MLRPHRDDLSATQPDFHQLHEVGPRRGELRFTDRPAGPIRVDAMTEKQLGAVDVADAGDDRLVHQQRAYWPARLANPRPRPLGIGVATQRIGAEPGDHIGDLSFVDDFTHRRPAEVGAVLGADHSHPHRPDRVGHRFIGRSWPLGELAVQAEMHMHRRPADVVVKQMLSPRGGLSQLLPVDGCRREPALRTGHPYRSARVTPLLAPGQSMKDSPFGHPGPPPLAPGTGGGWWVRSYSSRMSIRRWWRSAFDHGVVKNASTMASASGTVCMRPPMPIS